MQLTKHSNGGGIKVDFIIFAFPGFAIFCSLIVLIIGNDRIRKKNHEKIKKALEESHNSIMEEIEKAQQWSTG